MPAEQSNFAVDGFLRNRQSQPVDQLKGLQEPLIKGREAKLALSYEMVCAFITICKAKPTAGPFSRKLSNKFLLLAFHLLELQDISPDHGSEVMCAVYVQQNVLIFHKMTTKLVNPKII